MWRIFKFMAMGGTFLYGIWDAIAAWISIVFVFVFGLTAIGAVLYFLYKVAVIFFRTVPVA